MVFYSLMGSDGVSGFDVSVPLSSQVLETLIKNCSDIVHQQVAEKDILHEMVKIVKKKVHERRLHCMHSGLVYSGFNYEMEVLELISNTVLRYCRRTCRCEIRYWFLSIPGRKLLVDLVGGIHNIIWLTMSLRYLQVSV